MHYLWEVRNKMVKSDFDRHENASGSCERFSVEEAFYRYIKCNKLPVDVNGIIDLIKDGIVQDWEKTDISFIASPYLSHDIPYLFEMLKPESIIWSINDPRYTITSFYNKGWYKIQSHLNASKIHSIDPNLNINQSFGRIIPQGNEFLEWSSLTRIGQIILVL